MAKPNRAALKNEEVGSVHIVVAVLKAFVELNKRITALPGLPPTRILQEHDAIERSFDVIAGTLREWQEGAARWLKHHEEDPKPFLRWVDKLWVARNPNSDWNSDWPSLIRPKRLYHLVELFRAANIVATGITPRGADPTSLTDTEQAKDAKNTKKPSKIAQAMALLTEHPEMEVQEIAKRVDCHEKYLSGSKLFVAARKRIKELGRQSIPRGRKGKDGRIEADDD